MISVLQNRKWLYEQYINLGKTSREIAHEVGCGQTAVWRWLKRYSISTRMSGPQRKKVEYYIDKKTGCYICTSHYKNKEGYPQIRRRECLMQIARWVYIKGHNLKLEDIAGLEIRHICDTPSCINLDHLLVGTSQDNANDMLERGRSVKSEKNGRSKLTKDQVMRIRKEYITNNVSQRSLAIRFDVGLTAINYAIRGKTWKYAS